MDARVSIRLSELEGCALGLVWRLGPCPAYAVKREFELSASSSWSASAGAIYPLMKKLERLGLIDGRDQLSAGKTRRLYTATATGLARLGDWLRALPAHSGEAVPEPIRTRAFFLDALGPEDRRSFLHEAKDRTRKAIEKLEATEAISKTDWDVRSLASLAALFELRARADWIEVALKAFLQPTSE